MEVDKTHLEQTLYKLKSIGGELSGAPFTNKV